MKFETEEADSRPSQQSVLDVTPVMSWIDPEQKLKGVILCVHGLGLHKGTYAQFGERMAKEGYAVYAVDVRGFGAFLEMPGQRKCDFPKCLDDVRAALELVRKTHPQLPVFLLGESMGGAIAIRVTSMHPELVEGLISSVPGAARYGQTKNAIKVGLKLLSAPNAEMDVTDVVVNQSTKKEELKKAWSKDPLARFNLSPIELLQFQQFMEENSKSAKRIKKTPVLMVQGASDALVRQDSNISIVNRIQSEDSQLILVEGGEHLIFEEGQFDENVIKILSEWLEQHLKSLGR
ncbi:MAG: lysophospholipase [Candidatus Obscuribacterales bacterium]|nr:lysophospholipase [Candidatus Obscuribacterales bacterium]